LFFLKEKKGTYERVEQHNDLDTSQNPHLHNFYRFSQDLTGCKLVAIDWTSQYPIYFFQVPANFLFLVTTIGQELGH
jgi:hypothetical protein